MQEQAGGNKVDLKFEMSDFRKRAVDVMAGINGMNTVAVADGVRTPRL